MKKKVLAVVLILTMCFIFASCGKDAKESPYVGTWKAINASVAGVEMSVEEVMGGEMIFEFKDNGKCTLTLADEKETAAWTETEGGFCVDDEIDFEVDGDTALADYDGVTITLEKQ